MCVFACGVVHGCCVVVVGWCGVWVWGGVVCLCFSLVFPLILFILSLAVSLSLFLSLLFSPLFSLLSSLPLFPSRQQTLHKSTDQQTWRPTGRHGLWLRRRRLMSSIPLLFRSCSMKTSLANDFAVVRLETKEGPFYYRNISGEEFIFYYSFKLIPKTRRRGKLQSLQFYINSKTIGL